jgi:P4 family phage/plasmid primase-like protien
MHQFQEHTTTSTDAQHEIQSNGRGRTAGQSGDRWAKRATDLAVWADKYLVNRRDAFGHYVTVEHRKDPDLTAYTDKNSLTLEVLQRHFEGKSTGDLIGLHSTSRDQDGTCRSRWAAVDVDRHDNSVDAAVTWKAAKSLYERARNLGFRCLLFDSNGRGGYHLLLIFDRPVETRRVYRFLKWITRNWKCLGLVTAPEVFPKQESIASERFGNWLRLPGRHHTHDHYTRVWNGSEWLEGEAGIEMILATTGTPDSRIPDAAAKGESPKKSERNNRPMDLDRDARLARQALPYVKHMAIAYNDWITIGMCLAELGLAGLALWIEWSQNCPEKFDENACERKWRTFTSGNAGELTLGTLFHLAKQSGWPGPGRTTGGGTPKLVAGSAAANTQPKGPDHVAGIELHDAPPDAAEAIPYDSPFNMTDLGNAERLVHRHGKIIRYVPAWKKWLKWDGRRWKIDDELAVPGLVKETIRSILNEAAFTDDLATRRALAEWALMSENHRQMEAVMKLAASEAAVVIQIECLDRDPWLLNCANGTIDLRTGELRSHRPEDYITKLCPVVYDPAAKCPLWEDALALVFDGRASLIRYWNQLCGCCLTGSVSEQILPILYGRGENGKSTLLNTLLAMLGLDYAIKAPHNFLMKKKHEAHPTELADLFGKRLVVATETGEGTWMDEVRVKELTGSDVIRARRLYENNWQFKPTHKILLCTNHKPVIRGTDHAIWRRIHLIPFGVKIPADRKQKNMPDRLAAEYPGILAWCVKGCIEWQRDGGLEPPDEVRFATDRYREGEDHLAGFLAERCTLMPGEDRVRVKANTLFEAYKKHAEHAGETPISLRSFGERITAMGVEKKTSNGVWYLGIGLRAEQA